MGKLEARIQFKFRTRGSEGEGQIIPGRGRGFLRVTRADETLNINTELLGEKGRPLERSTYGVEIGYGNTGPNNLGLGESRTIFGSLLKGYRVAKGEKNK